MKRRAMGWGGANARKMHRSPAPSLPEISKLPGPKKRMLGGGRIGECRQKWRGPEDRGRVSHQRLERGVEERAQTEKATARPCALSNVKKAKI